MNIFLIILVVLLAFSAGLNIGRLATLWQFSEEDKEPCEIKLGLPDGASFFRDSLAAIRDISGDKGGEKMRPWASRKSMKARIDAMRQENAELRQQVLDLKNVVEQMDGIGHCVSNYCLGCKFCLFIGHSHQIPIGCMRDKLCRHFESVDTQA